MKKTCSLFLFGVIVALWNGHLCAQVSPREAVGVPPADLYKTMLDSLATQDYARIEKNRKVLSPLLSHFRTRYGLDIGDKVTAALSRKEDKEILKGIQQMVFLDMKDLFDESVEKAHNSPGVARAYLEQAFRNYRLLSPSFLNNDPAADTQIKEGFRNTFRALGASAPLGQEKPAVDVKWLKDALEQIEKELMRVLPHLRTS